MSQTEGYLRGLQGFAWETPPAIPPASEDTAGWFLHDVRAGLVALRGRIKKDAGASAESFLKGLVETFPETSQKPFAKALARLWVRWIANRPGEGDALAPREIAREIGKRLKKEYEEGIAGELSAYLLDDRLHLRNTRDYLRMRGWLRGIIENLGRRADWESRERAEILKGNFASIVLRALHNGNVGYAAEAVAGLPRMTSQLDRAIANLKSTEPEASHFLLKNKSTILTHALHGGYLRYPEQAAAELPRTLKELNRRIGALENSSPQDASVLRSNVPSLIYRALTNGKIPSR